MTTCGHRAAIVVALPLLCATVVAAQPATSVRVVTELRIHGNHSVPDGDVMRMVGIAPGDRIGPDTLDTIVARCARAGGSPTWRCGSVTRR